MHVMDVIRFTELLAFREIPRECIFLLTFEGWFDRVIWSVKVYMT